MKFSSGHAVNKLLPVPSNGESFQLFSVIEKSQYISAIMDSSISQIIGNIKRTTKELHDKRENFEKLKEYNRMTCLKIASEEQSLQDSKNRLSAIKQELVQVKTQYLIHETVSKPAILQVIEDHRKANEAKEQILKAKYFHDKFISECFELPRKTLNEIVKDLDRYSASKSDKDLLERLKQTHEKSEQMNETKKNLLKDATRLKDENRAFSQQIKSFEDRTSNLKSEIHEKIKQLELSKAQIRNQRLSAEDDHHVKPSTKKAKQYKDENSRISSVVQKQASNDFVSASSLVKSQPPKFKFRKWGHF